MKNLLKRFVREEEGQDLIEYVLVAAIITVAAWTAISVVGTNVATLWGRVSSVTTNAAS